MRTRQFMQWGAAALAVLPVVAWAHVGQDGASANFMAGAHHPFSGLDHLLAMLAVGIWAAQNGGRSVWMVPTAFVSLMLAGAAVGLAGVGMPYVEQGIVASLLVLGLLIAGACRLDSLIGVLIRLWLLPGEPFSFDVMIVAVLSAVIWILYLSVSKRASITFQMGRPWKKAKGAT